MRRTLCLRFEPQIWPLPFVYSFTSYWINSYLLKLLTGNGPFETGKISSEGLLPLIKSCKLIKDGFEVARDTILVSATQSGIYEVFGTKLHAIKRAVFAQTTKTCKDTWRQSAKSEMTTKAALSAVLSEPNSVDYLS